MGAHQRRAPVVQPHRRLHDNTVAESFFATVKNEMCCRASFATRAAAKHAVIELIEADCDRRRPFDHRLQGARACHGAVLRAREA